MNQKSIASRPNRPSPELSAFVSELVKDKNDFPKDYLVPVIVNGKVLVALRDTGASISLIAEEAVPNLEYLPEYTVAVQRLTLNILCNLPVWI